MLLRPIVSEGGMQRQLAVGDVLAGGDAIPAAITTATDLTITGDMLLQKYILRSATGVCNENIDTAANIVAAILAGSGMTNVPKNLTWICRWIETTANALTVQATANTGVTVTRGTVAASSAKDFLITIKNGTPAQTFQCTTTSGSAIVGGLTAAQCALLTPGMIVTNAVANLQGQTIIAVNPNAGTVTLSGNANATNTTPVTVAFSPVVLVEGLAP